LAATAAWIMDSAVACLASPAKASLVCIMLLVWFFNVEWYHKIARLYRCDFYHLYFRHNSDIQPHKLDVVFPWKLRPCGNEHTLYSFFKTVILSVQKFKVSLEMKTFCRESGSARCFDDLWHVSGDVVEVGTVGTRVDIFQLPSSSQRNLFWRAKKKPLFRASPWRQSLPIAAPREKFQQSYRRQDIHIHMIEPSYGWIYPNYDY
jgi:hypothetical protein